jgi:hypothetical protein
MLTSSITAFGETLATSNENLLIRIADKINDISRSPTPKRIEDTMVAVVGIQHMFNLEEVGPVAQMEEGHHNGKLFGAACLLRKRGPCFDQRGRGATHYR